MKQLLIIAFLLFAYNNLYAQKIHWISFFDTTDPDIGCAVDMGKYERHFVDIVTATLSSKGYQSHKVTMYGANCSPQKCRNEVNSLSVSSDDIVVFYYSGHGARPIKDRNYDETHPFPYMCLASHVASELVPAEWVLNTLKSKNPRLSIVITDCCNTHSRAIPINYRSANFRNRGRASLSQKQINNCQKLFLNYKGDVIITASSPGEPSLGGELCGGIFTYSFLTVFDEIESMPSVSWNDVLSSAKSMTTEITTEIENECQTDPECSRYTPDQRPKKHHPVFKVNVSSVQSPNTSTQNPPPPPPIGGSNNDDWQNALTNHLNALCNVNYSDDNRMQREEALGNLFEPNTLVKIYAQDENIVVDRETYDVFLGRLSTSSILLSVTVVGGILSPDGKIKELFVREVYKR